MATLTYQQAKVSGTAVNLVAADAAGDKVVPGSGALMVRNASAGSISVTLDVPGNTKYGLANPDLVVAVAAGATTLIGPLPGDLAGSDGLVAFTYSAVASVTVAAVSI